MVAQSTFTICNPAPLGLFAFALTTALLQMYHSRITGGDKQSILGTKNLVWGFGMFYGGFAQFCVGMWEAIRNNLFGFVAFSSYGAFWMGIAIDYFFHESLGSEKYPFDKEMAQAMYSIWGIFTFALWTLTFNLNYTLCTLFFELMILFFVLAAGVKDEGVDKIGGYIGLVTAATAFYLGYIEMLNDIVGKGKEIIPLGHVNPQAAGHGGFYVGGNTQTPAQVMAQLHALQIMEEKFTESNENLKLEPKLRIVRKRYKKALKSIISMQSMDGDGRASLESIDGETPKGLPNPAEALVGGVQKSIGSALSFVGGRGASNAPDNQVTPVVSEI